MCGFRKVALKARKTKNERIAHAEKEEIPADHFESPFIDDRLNTKGLKLNKRGKKDQGAWKLTHILRCCPSRGEEVRAI